MSNVLYAVLERNFEYNDETYNPSEGGKPVKLFKTEEKAEAYALELTVADFKRCFSRKSNYGYDTFIPFEASYDVEHFNLTKEVCAILDKLDLHYEEIDYGDLSEELGGKLCSKLNQLSQDEINVLFSSLENPLYEVYEVECDE